MNKLKSQMTMLTLAAMSLAIVLPGCKYLSGSGRTATEWKRAYQQQKDRADIAHLTSANEKIALQKVLAQLEVERKAGLAVRKENERLAKELAELKQQQSFRKENERLAKELAELKRQLADVKKTPPAVN